MEIAQIKNDNKTDGRSLLPLLNGNKLEDVPAYLESGFNLKDSSMAVMGIRTPKYKYFCSMKNPTKNVHLFDLEKDPLEEINIANSQKRVVEDMEKILSKIRSEPIYEQNNEIQGEEMKEMEAQLRKLGYI